MQETGTADEVLLASVASDPEAFAVFYRRHEDRILRYFLRRGATAELAADLTAEVFAAALERTAVEARVLEERDYSDIARDLSCSEAVVRQRVSRGLARLRRQLDGRRT
jgi:DNA-directed RNA polymerase specialized sigma24 family protein